MADGPKWGYKVIDGVMTAKLFEDGNRPDDWADTPAQPQPKPARKQKPAARKK